MTVGELMALLERYDPSLPVVFDRRDHGFVEVGNVVVKFNVSRFEPPGALSGPPRVRRGGSPPHGGRVGRVRVGAWVQVLNPVVGERARK